MMEPKARPRQPLRIDVTLSAAQRKPTETPGKSPDTLQHSPQARASTAVFAHPHAYAPPLRNRILGGGCVLRPPKFETEASFTAQQGTRERPRSNESVVDDTNSIF